MYDNFAEDDDLLVRARREGRVLLTRDRPLAGRAAESDETRFVFLESGRLEDQLGQLVTDVGVDLDRPTFTRCLECNVTIESVDQESVRESVPPYVLRERTHFFRCLACDRVYWSGSHTERMTARIDTIRASIGDGVDDGG